ncbi:hypothetical protein AB0E55_14045 [Amycolatopsis keratiniphila]|uniref:WXG100 family type VII secretion target n=1 Tax=Amycolatopsis keratiniphila TaxID=129921 RepID=UPI003404A5B5
MADKFRLDPAGMQEMLVRLRSGNADFLAALTELNHTLDRYEGCWGEDKAGKQFADGYVKNARDVRKGLGDISKGVGDLSDGVNTTVGEFRDLDEENAKTFDHGLAESMRQQKNES